MSMTQISADLKQQMDEVLSHLDRYVRQAAQAGQPIHEVEREIWQQVLQLGHHCLAQFLALQGNGDQGATIAAPDGGTWRRLEHLHTRPYVSIFGAFTLGRVVYGSREGQKIDFVPLDNRLQLPASPFSYVLQDWDQALCVEQAFGQARTTVARMLNLPQSVDSLEHMNVQMAQHVTAFRENRPRPEPETEGALLVTSADGKGIVMRRDPETPAPAGHRTKGDKASQKRMATVGTAYTVDRYVRTPEDVVAALFGDGPKPPPRPQPAQQARVGQLAPTGPGGEVAHGPGGSLRLAFERGHRAEPAPGEGDGASVRRPRGVVAGPAGAVAQRNTTDVLDLLHMTPRLWQAAHVFYPEGSTEAEAFARERILRVLQGKVELVVRGLREMGSKRRLIGSKKKTLAKVCTYLVNNRTRMRYDEYLTKGYPIASGAIEGACRHLVKDRMERAGMHWTPAGAQAMLDVRSTYLNGDWEEYQAYRITSETNRLYPHRQRVEGPQYYLAV